MPTPRRILVPFDFAGPSKRACDYALDLGAAVGASLSLVHVIERVTRR
ncbi:MAG: Universal stress protein family [Labilithrix sp.]|nr:Universal stress protein family [Labilithrix sp.]